LVVLLAKVEGRGRFTTVSKISLPFLSLSAICDEEFERGPSNTCTYVNTFC